MDDMVKSVNELLKGTRILMFLLFLLLMTNSESTAQTMIPKRVVDRTNLEIVEFLIARRELDRKTQLDKLLGQFRVFELLRNEPLAQGSYGIYGFSVNGAPYEVYLMLISDDSHQILRLKNIASAIRKSIRFLEKMNVENKAMAEYLKEILILYDRNGYDKAIKM